MNTMENARALTDYDKFQTPAEMRSNKLIQLIRDAAIEQDLENVLHELSVPQPDIQSQQKAAAYILKLLGNYVPSTEKRIREQMSQYAEHEYASRRNNTSARIRKVFSGEAYFMNPYLESDAEYGSHDPVADVVDMKEYLERTANTNDEILPNRY